jgi:hypothetical protein
VRTDHTWEENAGLMYVGLDVRKKVCYGTIMDGKGEAVKDGKFDKGPWCLDKFLPSAGVEGRRFMGL